MNLFHKLYQKVLTHFVRSPLSDGLLALVSPKNRKVPNTPKWPLTPSSSDENCEPQHFVRHNTMHPALKFHGPVNGRFIFFK